MRSVFLLLEPDASVTIRIKLVLVFSALFLVLAPINSTAQTPSRTPDEIHAVSATDDATIDSLYVWRSRGGSGWKQSAQCVKDGASDAEVCRTWYSTSYSFFSNVQIHPSPSTPTEQELSKYLMPDCAPPDSTRPEQAVMWRLAHPTAENLTWHEGKPQPPVDVCLPISQAKTLARSSSTPGGQPENDPGQWIAYYSNLWQNRSGIQDSTKVAVKREMFTIYRWRHSLAIYRPEQNQHAWFLNEGKSEGIFKVDRWDRFAEIRYTNDVLEVDLRPGLAVPETVQIGVDELMP